MGMAAILVMWHKSFEQTFIPLSHGGSTWNLASIGLEISKEKKLWIWVTLDEGQRMTLTFAIHTCTDLVNCIYQLWQQRLQ